MREKRDEGSSTEFIGGEWVGDPDRKWVYVSGGLFKGGGETRKGAGKRRGIQEKKIIGKDERSFESAWPLPQRVFWLPAAAAA